MTDVVKTVSDTITAGYESMTRAEKQLANSLLDNYPVSGLGSITTVAEAAGVSTPTVVRMVQKLGFNDSIQLIRGPEGSTVRLTVRRADGTTIDLVTPRRRIRA